MKHFISVVLAVMMVVGMIACGGGGGSDGGGAVDTKAVGVHGVYRLSGIGVVYTNGTHDSVVVPPNSDAGGRLTINTNNYVTIELWTPSMGHLTVDGWYENGYIGDKDGRYPLSVTGNQAILTFGPEYCQQVDKSLYSMTLTFTKTGGPYNTMTEESVEIVEDAEANGELGTTTDAISFGLDVVNE